MVRTRWGSSIAQFVLVLVVSLATWYLFMDPKLSCFKIYPQPGANLLFWALMTFIFSAFNFELWPFTRLSQPLSGIASTVTGLVFALVIIAVLNFGWGSLDPAFNPGRAGGAGWFAAALVVLIGFFMWSTLAANMEHWPWTDLGLKQPAVGVIELFIGFALTTIGYLVLIYPNVAAWADKAHAPLGLNTALGWFYSVIVGEVVAVQLWENRPWSLIKNRALKALVSFVGNFIFGTIIYFVFLGFLEAVLPAAVQSAIGAGMSAEPAQLGVCVVMWALFWGLVFGRWPTHLSTGANLILRTVIVIVLSYITYWAYYNFLATWLLHEPRLSPATGAYGGNALIWIDWVILFLFYYVVNFGAYGLAAKAE